MKPDQIENLLNRYLNGDTTNEEEEQLRQYFTQAQMVPLAWEPYKALFSWEKHQQSAAQGGTEGVPSTTIRPFSKYRLLVAASIAALLLVGAGITTMLLGSDQNGGHAPRNYAVLDGRYTTDADIIAREAEMALQLVAASDEETFDAINDFATP